jgi:hypothetical protein
MEILLFILMISFVGLIGGYITYIIRFSLLLKKLETHLNKHS